MTREFSHPSELNWIGVRFLDPIGRVFLLDGDYYRAIYPDKVEYVKNLIESDVIKQLIEKKLIFPIQETELKVEGYGMVLKSPGTTWSIKGHTFPRRIFQKMVLNWIEINNL